MSVLPKLTYKFKVHSQTPSKNIFVEIDKFSLTLLEKYLKGQSIQKNFEKEEQS